MFRSFGRSRTLGSINGISYFMVSGGGGGENMGLDGGGGGGGGARIWVVWGGGM
jgi:hypothetical protein